MKNVDCTVKSSLRGEKLNDNAIHSAWNSNRTGGSPNACGGHKPHRGRGGREEEEEVMTAKQLLKFIDSIRADEGIDFIADELRNQRDNILAKMESNADKKDKKIYKDILEKLEAIEMMKFQRILYYKLAGF